MKMSRFVLAILCLVCLATVHLSMAQQFSLQNFLDGHNANRSAVGVADITWDATVAAYAKNYANQMMSTCSLVHSGGPYGENLAWSSSSAFTATAAVNLWTAEQQFYTYATNTCAAGKVCGHYTQVVWANSVKLGCAGVVCSANKGTFIICSYDPPGNYVGQKPY